MIEIKESDLVEGFFWDDDKEYGFNGMLLCKKPFGRNRFISIDDGGITVWEKFEPKKEPEYVPWKSIDEIPEEFWNGWIKYKNNEYSKIFNVDTYGKLTIYLSGKWLDLIDIFEDLTWSPTFNGEYKPCGKPKD